MPDTLTIENHGPYIRATNYWQTEAARRGRFLLSLNAGAFRLLIPPAARDCIPDLRTAKEVVLSRGPWPAEALPDAFEILFDDYSDDPYAIWLAPHALDRLPPDADIGRPFTFSAWEDRRGRPHRILDRPAHYRRSPRLPDLRPATSPDVTEPNP